MSKVKQIKIPDSNGPSQLNANSSLDERPLKGYELSIMNQLKKDSDLVGHCMPLAITRIEALFAKPRTISSLKEAIESLVESGYVTIEDKSDGTSLVLTEKGYKKTLEL